MAIPPTDIRILFTNYDIITYFLNLASCSEHCISIKHRILATFNINEKKKILTACMPLIVSYWCLISCYLLQVLRTDYFYRDQYSVSFLLAFRLKRTCRCWVGVGCRSPMYVSLSYVGQRQVGVGSSESKVSEYDSVPSRNSVLQQRSVNIESDCIIFVLLVSFHTAASML